SSSGSTIEGTASVAPPDSAAIDAGSSVDSVARAPAVPTTMPRVPRRLSRQGAQDATERPSYARLQWLPNLSADFVRQFGVDSTPAWTAHLARVSVTLGDCSGTIVSRDGLVVTSAACLDSALTSAGQSALPDDVVLAAPG